MITQLVFNIWIDLHMCGLICTNILQNFDSITNEVYRLIGKLSLSSIGLQYKWTIQIQVVSIYMEKLGDIINNYIWHYINERHINSFKFSQRVNSVDRIKSPNHITYIKNAKVIRLCIFISWKHDE